MPPIATKVLSDEDFPWQCRTCLFAAVARKGGAGRRGLSGITGNLILTRLRYWGGPSQFQSLRFLTSTVCCTPILPLIH